MYYRVAEDCSQGRDVPAQSMPPVFAGNPDLQTGWSVAGIYVQVTGAYLLW